jgi:hypothetical protein
MLLIVGYRWICAVALAAALVVGLGPARATAREYRAGTAASLDAALAAAEEHPGADTVRLAPGVYLPVQTLELRGTLTIEGPATAPGARLDGGSVEPYPSAALLVARGADVTLRNLLVSTGGGPAVGAVQVLGDAHIASAAIVGSNGPGLTVADGGRAMVENTTVSDGAAAGVVGDGRVELHSATVAGNSGGGVDGQGDISLWNTIVSGNGFSDCAAPVRSSRSSLDGDGTCGVGLLSGRGSPLGPVASNGGPTPTRALIAGSPAIGGGDPAGCPAADQRGYLRAAGTCDIGAFAVSAAAPNPAGSAAGRAAAPRVRALSVDGHLRTRAGSLIRVHVRARERTARGVVRIVDAAGHLDVRSARITSLRFGPRALTVTVRGVGTDRRTRRRHAFTFSLHIGKRRASGRLVLAGRPPAQGRLRRARVTSARLQSQPF